jgi:tRNA G18 (ribose-2'-O)-methylase SpoU
MSRTETRQERYSAKQAAAKEFPVSVAATNFSYDGNVAYLMRALACFGGKNIHIIGNIPKERELKRLSGGHSSLVKIINHKRPEDFIVWAKNNNVYVMVAELTDGAINIHDAHIPLNKEVIFVVGNEMDGVPVEISLTADKSVYIPMPGKGFCLNTSQTANVLLYEYSRRVLTHTCNND